MSTGLQLFSATGDHVRGDYWLGLASVNDVLSTGFIMSDNKHTESSTEKIVYTS
jgi:fibronectin type 3 domain-containing protein